MSVGDKWRKIQRKMAIPRMDRESYLGMDRESLTDMMRFQQKPEK